MKGFVWADAELFRQAVKGVTDPMLVTTERVVAVQCPSCGKLGVHTFFLFTVNSEDLILTCECGFRKMQISRKSRMVCVQVSCIICEQEHLTLIPLSEVLQTDLLTLCCPNTRVELAYWGASEAEVLQASQESNSLSEVLDSVENDYLTNRQVMIEALRILERFADSGLLRCECGNERIDLDVYSDKIELACPACGSLLLMYAETPADIEPLRRLASITLRQGGLECIDAASYSDRSGSKKTPSE